MLRDDLVDLPEELHRLLLARLKPIEIITLYIAYLCSKDEYIEKRLRPHFFCALSHCTPEQLSLLVRNHFSTANDASKESLAYQHFKHLALHSDDLILKACYRSLFDSDCTYQLKLDFTILSMPIVLNLIETDRLNINNVSIRLIGSLGNTLDQYALLLNQCQQHTADQLRKALVNMTLHYMKKCVANGESIDDLYSYALDHECFAGKIIPGNNGDPTLFAHSTSSGLTLSQTALRDGYLRIKPRDGYDHDISYSG